MSYFMVRWDILQSEVFNIRKISSFHRLGISKDGVIITRKDPSVIPTLHTEDPRFPGWFETVYKKEYKPKHKQ